MLLHIYFRNKKFVFVKHKFGNYEKPPLNGNFDQISTVIDRYLI